MKHASFETSPLSPTEELLAANQRIEEMIGQTDLEPEHLEQALQEAQVVYNKYENAEGDADFDMALDVLLGTIQNTRDLEDAVMQKSANHIGGMEEDLKEAA